MAIVRWSDPFANPGARSPLDDILNGFWGTGLVPATHGAPAMDVYTEDDQSMTVEVQAPGFTKEDIEVHVHDGALEIKGEKHQTQEDGKQGKRNYMVRESHASFYRSLQLPKVADSDNVKADFHNGMLKITVPFKESQAPNRIAINDSGAGGDADKPSKKK